MQQKPKILVLGHDASQQAALAMLFAAEPFEPTFASVDALTVELDRSPTLAVLCSDPAVSAWRDDAGRGRPYTPSIALVTAERVAELSEATVDAITDFLVLPIEGPELLARVRRLVDHALDPNELADRDRGDAIVLELTQALASSLDLREILFTVVTRIASVVRVDRVSIVLAPEPDSEDVGYVVVTSDDWQISNLKLDLGKYPEIQRVLRTQKPLTIEDVGTHPVLGGMRDELQHIRLRSLTLVPIVWDDQARGVLFLRAVPERGKLLPREVRFCRIVAEAAAVALRNARILHSLREETRKITHARVEAERRAEALKRYADLFASLADGIALLDAEGRLLFANPCAYEIAGHPVDARRGEKIKGVIHPDDRDRVKQIWVGCLGGNFPRNVDLRIVRTDGASVTCSVSFASLMDGEGAVLVSFRDVTDQRRLEEELVHTKEFLESLIDASPDGIVAADMKGAIILFNKGAQRIYGYRSGDVIGKMSVRALYPGDGARQVMAMVRSPLHGGEGRLESVRIEAQDSTGARLPILLSAAMIYRDGKPVATFGIFTDLRERLRVEERLSQAQQKLAVSAKQALIAELAGTAAHELNQPLTSVMGYAELLARQLDRGSKQHHAADIIVREAERMADIVRKIGKITRYETKSYVGDQKILDLDRAVEEGPGTTTIENAPKRR